ncbi:MAG: hypothetical protein FJY76_00420 [Candidatus Aenigmarchaeota archaeon]|nr:hypothetical protein [Candidatus Aenigmarchaeota archaeon]
MGIFGGKKKEPPKRRGWNQPYYTPSEARSREYRLFMEQELQKPGWYESAVGFASKILHVKADEGTKKLVDSAVSFTGMKITPDGVMSLFVLTIIAFAVAGVALMAGGIVPVLGGLIVIIIGAMLAFYLMKYPGYVLKYTRIDASSQIVLAILYMVVSMRISPNLEEALRFAASNISGALAWDMRRLLWDIEMRKYYSADDAVDDYIVRWKPENEEFSEALRLIRDSKRQTPERGRLLLDEALNVILKGTKVRMRHYAQDLRLPVMVIHMMGIVLPILGTIMAPLAAVFMADVVQPIHFIVGYDIALPIVIVWFINNTLRRRPVTVSQVDVKSHPGLPKPGHFIMGKSQIPALPIGIIVMAAILLFPIFYFASNPGLMFPPVVDGKYVSPPDPDHVTTTVMSMLIVIGIGAGLATYFMLSNFQAVRVRSGMNSIEGEFELALFQLGNRIGAGTPTEVAIEKSIDDVKDLKISNLFKLTLRNIRDLGMTFEDALFHPQWGALKFYPSKLLLNIMSTVVDTSKKGTSYAAESMLKISRYLKNIRETQEFIRGMLSETVSSMRFQAYFLTPLITGLIVSMADIIIQVLTTLGQYLQKMQLGSASSLGLDFSLISLGTPSTSPAVFQMIVGIYLLEMVVILAMFITKISEGENKSLQWYTAGKMLLISMIVYFMVAYASTSMFGDLIKSALAGLNVGA